MGSRHSESVDKDRLNDMEELHKIHEDGGILYDHELRKLVEDACDWDWDVQDGRLRHDATSGQTSVTFDFAPDDFDEGGRFLGGSAARNHRINQFLEEMGCVDPDVEDVASEASDELMLDAHVAMNAVDEMFDGVGAWVRNYYRNLAKAASLGKQAFDAALGGEVERVHLLSWRIKRLGEVDHAEDRWYWGFAAEALTRRAMAFHSDNRVIALRTYLSRRSDNCASNGFWTEIGPIGLFELLRDGSSDVASAVQELLAEVPTEEPAMSVAISAITATAVSIDGSRGDWATEVLARSIREGDDPCDGLLDSCRSIALTTLNVSRRAILIDALFARLRRELGLTSGK